MAWRSTVRWTGVVTTLVGMVLGVVVTGGIPSPSVRAAPAPVSATTTAEQQYVVRFHDIDRGDALTQALSLAGVQGSLARRGARIDTPLRHVFPGAIVRANPADVEQLAADPRVAVIEPVITLSLQSTQTNPPWGLDRMDQRALPLSGTFRAANGGQGVRVYVVDSGINPRHLDFGNRVASGFDAFDPSGDGRVDCNGHGTHVAGTIGGTTYGVAKAVTLVPVRIGDCGDAVTSANIVRGVEWILAHHAQVGGNAVVNMSLGGDGSTLLDRAVSRALADDLVVVAAAGNNGGDSCAVSPARSPATLTVSAIDRNDTRPGWANNGECVDLFAPGDDILSASYLVTNGSRLISGTSMAAPHVSGAAAVLRAAQPSLTARDVMASLITSATPGAVANAGTNTTSRLLYLDPVATPVPPRPDNDAFASAVAMRPAGTVTVTGTNVLATAEAGEPVHAESGGRQSVWWRFTAPRNGRVTLSTRGSDFDTVLAVYRGSAVSALTSVAFDDDVVDGVDRISEVTFDAVSGVTYRVAVDGWEGSWGAISLTLVTPWDAAVDPPAPPTPPVAGSGLITTLAPTRILDTRTTGTRVTTTPTRLRITGRNGLPNTGVAAIALNVTATSTTGTGYATIYPCGTPPNTSNLNFTLGQDIPNAVIAPLSTNGEICLTASTPTHLIIDLSAWFATS